MKNITVYSKVIFISFLNIVVFISSLYLSVIFFLILHADEAMKGKANENLKEEFSSFIQKLCDLPDSLFRPTGKNEMDLSGKLS